MSDFIVVEDNSHNTVISTKLETRIVTDKDTPTIITDNPTIITSETIVSRIISEGHTGPPGPMGPIGQIGLTGPAGPTGVVEDEMTYSKRVDFTTNETIIYRGEAATGSLESNPVWRIRRITIASDSDIKEEWADGVDTFIQIWADRLTISYS